MAASTGLHLFTGTASSRGQLVDVEDAISELGGVLTAEQQAKFDRAMEGPDRRRRELDDALDEPHFAAPAQQPRKPGRNEPCWCGSGKKYKKCHEAIDEGWADSGSGT